MCDAIPMRNSIALIKQLVMRKKRPGRTARRQDRPDPILGDCRQLAFSPLRFALGRQQVFQAHWEPTSNAEQLATTFCAKPFIA